MKSRHYKNFQQCLIVFFFLTLLFFIAYLHEYVVLTFEVIQTILFNVIGSPIISLTLLSPLYFTISSLIRCFYPCFNTNARKNSNKHNSTLYVSVKPEKRVDVTVKYFSRSFCWIF